MRPSHLYIHVPFCARRCSYCDFSIAVRRVIPVDEYIGSIEREILSLVDSSRPHQLTTVYLGGGTPSRLGSDGIQRLIGLVRESFEVDSGAEVTIEANPDDVSPEAVEGWKNAGVNRVSLGVQSFDDSVLAWMHRTHDAAQAESAVATIRNGGIQNISVDLIFALPDRLNRSWSSDLRKALDLDPDHISLYGLTIEKTTPLGHWHARGTVTAASEDSYATQFLEANALATRRGFEHYEVSNFARPGRRSRHNAAYWSGASYLGLGPSAHSFDGAVRSWNVHAYAEWAARLSSGISVVDGSEELTDENRAAERVYLGLRTNLGLSASAEDLKRANRWSEAGWAQIEDTRVRLTPEGWLRLDSLAAGLTGL